MLRHLPYRLQPKVKRVLAFRLDRELRDCDKDIMALFGISDFVHDWEDTWEWVEGTSAERIYVNVSRTHNQITGNYDVPVLVDVCGPESLLAGELFSGYAQRLANSLKTEVWLGKVVHGENKYRYDFEIERRFAPVAS